MESLVPASRVKLELLQIFRGVAALMVVLHHIHGSNIFYFNYIYLGGILEAGWSGVDFFFVLSGFIICFIHFNDIGSPQKILNTQKKDF